MDLIVPSWSEALIAFTRSGGYGYLLDRLSVIDRETLIIWGKHDRILGIKAVNEFKQSLPNSQLQWIDKCGTCPHLEMAGITARSILEFTKSTM